MAAYIIFIRDQTTNADELATYGPMARSSLAGHNARPLVAYGELEVLEGPPAEGVVVLAFPSIKEAKAWYDSPAYQEARQHRLNGAHYRGLIVEGV